MITAKEARKMAKSANEGINKKRFDALRETLMLNIMSEADSGKRGAFFNRSQLGSSTGIEFIIDELRENGFEVDVHRGHPCHDFISMYVSW